MTSDFIKLNPYIFKDKFNFLHKMEKLCNCRRYDCHTHSMSYHSHSPHILILTLFHKGCFQFNIKYDFKKKMINFKTSKDQSCDCLKTDISAFIKNNENKIKYFFTREVFPIHTAIQENDTWVAKNRILDKYFYKDINGIIKQYLCYFKKCSKCNKEITGTYDMCWDCWTKC